MKFIRIHVKANETSPSKDILVNPRFLTAVVPSFDARGHEDGCVTFLKGARYYCDDRIDDMEVTINRAFAFRHDSWSSVFYTPREVLSAIRRFITRKRS